MEGYCKDYTRELVSRAWHLVSGPYRFVPIWPTAGDLEVPGVLIVKSGLGQR